MQAGIIYGISVFVGIIACIGVTIGVDFVKEKRQSVHDRSNLLILRILKTGISLEAMPPWVSENGFSSFQAVC